MYKQVPNIVFGFHACEKSEGEKLISGFHSFKTSENRYDWLGHGMYFWESSIHRAERFAKDRSIENYCVIGAAIHLGYCLDLLESESLTYLSVSYRTLLKTLETAGTPLPKNKEGEGSSSGDLLLRDLDCAVINFIHSQRESDGLRAYDSVRGVFWEGKELYPNAGFKEKNHIQICIRNPNCVKGFFWPRQENKKFEMA